MNSLSDTSELCCIKSLFPSYPLYLLYILKHLSHKETTFLSQPPPHTPSKMNGPTTGRLLPPKVQGAHLPVLQCHTTIPLGTGRISHLVAEARGQHLPTNDPNAELPNDIKQELWDEWYEIVDEALRVLDERSTCSECGEIHYAPDNNVSFVSMDNCIASTC